MHRLQELVRLHRLGLSVRRVAQQLGMSPNTERAYRLLLDKANLLKGFVDDLPPLTTLRAAVETHKPLHTPPQQASSIESWTASIEELMADGATPKAIFDRLRTTEPDFSGSLSAVKRLYARLKAANGASPDDVVIPIHTRPGQDAQVDFGAVGRLWDPKEKRLRPAYVFVMVLGYSRHRFDRIVFDQKIETWLQLHVEAFEHFGGVPDTVVPDNLKSAVIRAAFDVRTEPVLNLSYRELARHFGFKIDPTPPYSPEKKGKVESGVRYFKRSFMTTIGDERDIDVLNQHVDRWVVEVAGKRTHATTQRQPLTAFEEHERTCLLPLPQKPWHRMSWRAPKVHRDCCALVEGARYSVPWRLVGKKLLARVTEKSVELYWEDTRVATHPRQAPGEHSVLAGHLPPKRGEYRERERGYWVERAGALGPDVHRYIQEIFGSDTVLSQLTKVQAIVRHLDNVPRERANAACRRASFYGSYSYRALKNILKKGLDREPLPQLQLPRSSTLENPRFARNIQELLELTPENIDASH